MATITFKAIDEDNQAQPGADIHVVFRGKILGQGYNTGIVDSKADQNGEVVIPIPLFTDHANFVITSGGNIAEGTVQINTVDDWVFWLNPAVYTIKGIVETGAPTDITALVAGGKKELVTQTEYDPLRVTAYKGSNALKKLTDWLVGNIITILVIIAGIGIIIYALKYLTNPIKRALVAGKTAAEKLVKTRVNY